MALGSKPTIQAGDVTDLGEDSEADTLLTQHRS